MNRFERFIQNFRYRPDRRGLFGGQWRILDPDDPQPEGDCEDFALTLSWILSARSPIIWLSNLYNRDFEIWTGKSDRGNRHAVLYWRGNWIDNIYPEFQHQTPHDMQRAYSPSYVLFKLVPEWIWPGLLILILIFLGVTV